MLAAMVITATAAFTVSVGNKSNKAEAAVVGQGYYFLNSASIVRSLLDTAGKDAFDSLKTTYGTTAFSISEWTLEFQSPAVQAPGTYITLSKNITDLQFSSTSLSFLHGAGTSSSSTASFSALSTTSKTYFVFSFLPSDSSTWQSFTFSTTGVYRLAVSSGSVDADQVIEDYKNSDQFETDVKASEWYQALETQVSTLTTQVNSLNSQLSLLQSRVEDLESHFETVYVHKFPTDWSDTDLLFDFALTLGGSTSYYAVSAIGFVTEPVGLRSSMTIPDNLTVSVNATTSATKRVLIFSPSFSRSWFCTQASVDVTYTITFNGKTYTKAVTSTSSDTTLILPSDTADIAELRAQLDSLRTEYNALVAQYNDLSVEYDAYKAEYIYTASDLSSKDSQIASLQQQNKKLQSDVDDYKTLTASLDKQIATLQSQVNTAEQTGYDRGYEEGHDSGYTEGYGKGITASQGQSLATWDGFFPSLFGSIAGFFVTVLGGTTIFGFSLWQLLLSVLAVIAIVAILKVVIR